MPNQGPSCKSGDPKADSSLPYPLLPLAHSLFQYENPMLLGMCQQNPDLSYQPPAFLCMQSARSPLMAPWQGFLCLSCQYGLIQCHYLQKANHEGTLGRPVTICPSEVLATSVQPTSLQPQCSPGGEWCRCGLASLVFKSTSA